MRDVRYGARARTLAGLANLTDTPFSVAREGERVAPADAQPANRKQGEEAVGAQQWQFVIAGAASTVG